MLRSGVGVSECSPSMYTDTYKLITRHSGGEPFVYTTWLSGFKQIANTVGAKLVGNTTVLLDLETV